MGEDAKMKRSNKNGENITQDESKVILKSIKKNILLCPDCEGKLLDGPCGGCAQNYLCEHCGSEFNITVWGGNVVGERISDAGPRDIGNRRSLYERGS